MERRIEFLVCSLMLWRCSCLAKSALAASFEFLKNIIKRSEALWLHWEDELLSNLTTLGVNILKANVVEEATLEVRISRHWSWTVSFALRRPHWMKIESVSSGQAIQHSFTMLVQELATDFFGSTRPSKTVAHAISIESANERGFWVITLLMRWPLHEWANEVNAVSPDFEM